MCGICGYVGQEQAAPILFKALKRLEYRGYDSAGMAILNNSSDGMKIQVKKDVGKVAEINSKLNFLDLQGSIGIAHTRWATHGGVTKENAHPHLSNNGKIVVVHNGIIENYQDLKEFLKSEGFSFYSETDTEVVPNLIEFEMKSGKKFEDAVIATLKRLEGYYAVLAMSKDEKKIIGARRGSPLVLGVGNGCLFGASDIPAFIDHTKKVMYLYDNDVAILDENSIKVFNIADDQFVNRYVDSVDWDLEQAMKGNFDHFMLKEISEQVDTVKKALLQDGKIVDRVADEIKKSKGVFFVGCGTAYNACLASSYVFSKIANMHVNVVLASEFPNYEHFLTKDTLVIAVSQSGETIDTIEAVRTAKGKGSRVISIVNVMGSSLTRHSDESLMTNAGPEICVVATKSYTSQLALLTLLAYAVAGRLDEIKNKFNYLLNVIYHLTSSTTRSKIKDLADRLSNKQHIFTIGRGLEYTTALESALKIKEVSYIHAEAFAGGELKHGSIALVENGTPCIVFASEENEKQIISNAVEIKSRGGYIVGVSSKNNEVFDFWIKVPEANSLNPILQIIPIQILAYQLAILRGCDPDKPRNLAKSVTVK
jgi:glucosamine--fructose-6-phosphate aminotransferase (isomerizing)